jgi:hypothetical protein
VVSFKCHQVHLFPRFSVPLSLDYFSGFEVCCRSSSRRMPLRRTHIPEQLVISLSYVFCEDQGPSLLRYGVHIAGERASDEFPQRCRCAGTVKPCTKLCEIERTCGPMPVRGGCPWRDGIVRWKRTITGQSGNTRTHRSGCLSEISPRH